MKTLWRAFLSLAAAWLFSCSAPQGSNGLVAAGQPRVASPTPLLTCYPKLFESAFRAGTEVVEDSITVELQPLFLGNLPLPSGRVVACDGVSDGQPFVQQFPVGTFPVELALARFNNDERVAFARILFSNQPVHHWQMAVWPGQLPIPMEGKDLYGYPVDAGMGMLMDEQAAQALDKFLQAYPEKWDQIFTSSFESESRKPRQGFLYRVNGQTISAFNSGFGDGHYASYIGFDQAGKPCRLITDFQVLDWQKN